MHRRFLDRLLSTFRSVKRHRCINPECSWEGIISTGDKAAAVGADRRSSWGARLLWFVAGVAVTLAAVQGARLYLAEQAAREAQLRAEQRRALIVPIPVEPGESYDGEALADEDPRRAGNHSELTLLRNCSWGDPGRNPYRGTVAQALTAARVPESAVRKFEILVENKMVSDRLLISREGITTASGRRSFNSASFDMAFGTVMCFDTRVNFRDAQVENADLYEATDADGRQYAIMIPLVCGNVAVLGERAERDGDSRTINGVAPEPATLALMAVGGALLAAFAGRRSRVSRTRR
ncbi:MAG: PEP-CTERM sorting domain-containing protein [Burkholderiaceae bacterium]|nr:PEP-CTERM sorting domain-containing protein [Burkholderiaceae bacterium]